MNRLFAWFLAAVWVLYAPPVFAAASRTQQPPPVIGTEPGHPADARPQHRAPEQTVKIGVLAKRGRQRCLEKWGPTADYLGSRIPGYAFKIVPLDFKEIYPAAEREEVDFMLADPSFYVGLEKLYGANRIATLKNRLASGVYDIFGGVIFCRADRDDIQNPDDLKGKTFMAVKETSFGGWQMAWRKLKKFGIDPRHDFRDLDFGGTHDAVVYAVRDGRVDAGTVRTDTLERMAMEGKIRMEDFRVLKHDDIGEDVRAGPLMHSTNMYPEWPFAKLKHTSNELAEKVAIALIDMPADCPAANAARCAGWTIPLNYQPVHECLRELRIGPYREFGRVTPGAVFRQYWLWLLAGLIVLIALALVAIYVLQLNRKLTRAVSAEKRHAHQQAEVARFGQFALSGVELDELFDRAVALVSQTLGTKYAKVLEHIPEKQILFLRAGVGWKEGWVGHKSVPDGGSSQSGYTLLQAKPVVAEDIHDETRFSPPALLTEHDVVGGVTVAIPGADRPFGVLGAHTDRMQRFSEDDAYFLEAVANILAGAIERCRAEDEIRRSEARFRDVAMNMSDWVWECDAEGHYTYCSDQTLGLLGYTVEEILGKTPFDLMPVEEAARVEKIFRKIAAGKEPIRDLENRNVAKDGHEIILLTNAVARLDEEGNLLGYRGVDKDITERKRTEEALKASEIRLRTITDSAQDAIIMMDPRGAITYWNPAGELILGYQSEEVIGQNLHKLLAPDHYLEAHHAAFPEFVRTGRGNAVGKTVELTARRKDGQEIDISLSLSAVSLDGEWHAVGILRDITEQKRAENELAKAKEAAEAANLTKSEFLANMSHEIRTPMTAILGFSEILQENLKCCTKCVEHENCQVRRQNDIHVDTICANGEHLIEIINDILDLSKIEAEKLEVEHVRCSPCQILSEVVSLMRVRAGAKNLSLEIEYHGPMPQSIQSDPTRLRQILINLTGNAVKFTEVGNIRLVARLLDAESNEPKMQFEVADSGVGMTEEQIANLFKPFHQVDTSTTRKFGGTGLGLTISKRLAKKLGGDITVRSAFGEGSTFTVTVETGPLDGVKLLDNPAEAQLTTHSDKKSAAPESKLDCRVLLAEDGPDNQRLIAFLLEKAGAEVVVADDGQIAHDLALAAQDARTPFDVILMDMQMPAMDGYEATAKLREAGYTGPIIALTAHAMTTDRDKCLAAGCNDYVTKPVDRKKLVSLVAEYASRQELHDTSKTPGT